MSTFTTTALILRHADDREHDKFIVALSPGRGKLHLRAKGTKKSLSKLSGSLEPVTHVTLTIAKGRRSDLITGSIIEHRLSGLRQDPFTFVAAQWFLELVDRVTKAEQDESRVFAYVTDSLRSMEAEDILTLGQRWLRLCRRAWQLLDLQGFAPSLQVCAHCHQPLGTEPIAYHSHQGLVHAREAGIEAFGLDTPTMVYLVDGVSPPDERTVFRQLHQLVERLIHQTLDQPLRSEPVLRSMMRFGNRIERQKYDTLSKT